MYRLLAAAGLVWAVAGAFGFPFPLLVDLTTVQDPRATLLEQGMRLHRLSMVLLGLALAATVVLVHRATSGRDGVGRYPSDSDKSEPEQSSEGSRTRAFLAALLLLALTLRLLQSNSGLWFDEVLTLIDYVRLPIPELMTTYRFTNNHLLYSLLAKGSVELLGESAWALRLPAILFGVASIWALYWMSAKVVQRREALLAATLLTVSYHHVWFSQNARGYTGLLLLVLLGTGLFLDGLRRTSRGLWIGYAAILSAAMYVHLTAGLVFAAHGLVYFFLFARRRLGGSGAHVSARYPGASELWPALGLCLGLLMTLQLYAIVLPQVVGALSAQASPGGLTPSTPSWRSPIWAVLEVVRGFNLGPRSVLALLGAGALVGIGWLRILRTEPLFAALIALPAPITLAALLATGVNLWPRYFFVNAGFAALAAASGSFAVGLFLAKRYETRSASAPARAGYVIGALLVAASAAMLPRNYRLPKQDYAGARDYVEANRGEGDSVATLGLLTSFPYERLYAPSWTPVASTSDLDSVIARSRRTWLVYSFPIYVESVHGDVLARVRSEFKPMKEFRGTVGGGTIFVLLRD